MRKKSEKKSDNNICPTNQILCVQFNCRQKSTDAEKYNSKETYEYIRYQA